MDKTILNTLIMCLGNKPDNDKDAFVENILKSLEKLIELNIIDKNSTVEEMAYLKYYNFDNNEYITLKTLPDILKQHNKKSPNIYITNFLSKYYEIYPDKKQFLDSLNLFLKTKKTDQQAKIEDFKIMLNRFPDKFIEDCLYAEKPDRTKEDYNKYADENLSELYSSLLHNPLCLNELLKKISAEKILENIKNLENYNFNANFEDLIKIEEIIPGFLLSKNYNNIDLIDKSLVDINRLSSVLIHYKKEKYLSKEKIEEIENKLVNQIFSTSLYSSIELNEFTNSILSVKDFFKKKDNKKRDMLSFILELYYNKTGGPDKLLEIILSNEKVKEYLLERDRNFISEILQYDLKISTINQILKEIPELENKKDPNGSIEIFLAEDSLNQQLIKNKIKILDRLDNGITIGSSQEKIYNFFFKEQREHPKKFDCIYEKIREVILSSEDITNNVPFINEISNFKNLWENKYELPLINKMRLMKLDLEKVSKVLTESKLPCDILNNFPLIKSLKENTPKVEAILEKIKLKEVLSETENQKTNIPKKRM